MPLFRKSSVSSDASSSKSETSTLTSSSLLSNRCVRVLSLHELMRSAIHGADNSFSRTGTGRTKSKPATCHSLRPPARTRGSSSWAPTTRALPWLEKPQSDLVALGQALVATLFSQSPKARVRARTRRMSSPKRLRHLPPRRLLAQTRSHRPNQRPVHPRANRRANLPKKRPPRKVAKPVGLVR